MDLDSEESNGKGLDALWYFGFNYSLSIVDIHFGGKVNNLFGKAGDMTVQLFEKLSGSVAGLGWYVEANESLVPDPLTAAASAGVDYGIPISDKASLTVGADADLTILQDFSFDAWDIWAKLGYDFNGNVSTWFKLSIDGQVDPSEITPSLQWNIKFSF